jgi:hypothetical protein
LPTANGSCNAHRSKTANATLAENAILATTEQQRAFAPQFERIGISRKSAERRRFGAKRRCEAPRAFRCAAPPIGRSILGAMKLSKNRKKS